MKKLFIALIILGGVFTMANAQVLRTLEEKEGYYPVVEIVDNYYNTKSKAILWDVYNDNLDIYFEGNVYKAVSILEYIDATKGFHTNTVFELNGHKITTKHPSLNGNVCGVYIDDKDYHKIDEENLFRFYYYDTSDNTYTCCGLVFKIKKQKIGNKTYELLIGNLCFTSYGERLWVREISE